MNVQNLAIDVGRRLKLAYGYPHQQEQGVDPSDLALPVAAGLGAAAGGWVGANRGRIQKFMTKDPDMSRIVESLRGIAGRIDGKISRNPATAGALAGAGLGAAGAAGIFGLKKLYDMQQEREHMRGQLSAQQSFPQQYQG